MDKFKFIFWILILNCVWAKRISELKCDETVSLSVDSRSQYPFLMEIVYPFQKQIITICVGVLISERFVLTTSNCIEFYKNKEEMLRVTKLKLPEEQYPYTDLIEVNQLYFNTSSPHGKYEIGLIELSEAISYHDGGTLFRPACLWKDTFYVADTYQLLGDTWQNGDWSNKVITKSFATTTNDECRKAFNHTSNAFSVYLRSHICFNTKGFRTGGSGYPIIINVRNRDYIFGIVTMHESREDTTFSLGAKISYDLSWIESIVWPGHASVEAESHLECGERKLKHKPLLAFAQPTYHGEFPWHVALYKNNKYICGGTIINRRTVLTAAHCVTDEQGTIPANRFLIVAGTYNLNDFPAEARNLVVKTVKVHDNFNRIYLENDIALLELNSAIDFSDHIQPICVSKKLEYNNFPIGVVAGWGRDELNQPSKVLLQATLPIRDNFECRDSNRNFFPTYLNDNNYCAGYQNGTNVCSGDSGGSMVFQHDSRWYIRGLVSLGVALPNTDRCDITQMVLFTNVPKFYDWIVNNSGDDQ